MNKASVHVTQPGDTTGLGALLSQPAAVGNPLPVIYTVNANIKSDILKYSPTTKLVYRRQSSTFERLPGDFFVGDPVNSATTWMTKVPDKSDQNRTLIQNWALNPADYYDPLNEPVIQLPPNYTDADLQDAIRKAQWLNTWMITALNIARVNGFKLAMFSFPTGTPPLSMWAYLFPALRLGKQCEAVLSLHEYSVEGTMQNPKPGNILRYRDVWNFLPEDCRIPIIISECGAGNGYDTSLHGQTWVNDLMWYDGQTCQDDYLLGFCAYQLGGGESNMVSTVSAYGSAISNFKCPSPVPVEPPDPHEPPLPPPVKPPVPIPTEESLNGTTVPTLSQIIDSNLHVWKFGAPVPMGYVILRDNVQFAGGQGNILLYWNHIVYTSNANKEWYRADATWTRVAGDPRLPTTVEGIDVSHYQGTIGWVSVKTQKKFTFIKATEGSGIVDNTFGINWANAKGIPRGAYHFYRFANSPLDQAALFVGALNKDYGELPLVVDLEDEATPANFNDLKTFVDLVQNTTKRRMIIYSGAWWFNKYHYIIPDWMKSYEWWLASYVSSAPVLPAGISKWTFWQYTSTGAVNGITGDVDLDRFNGTAADFQNYLNTVTYTPPAPLPATVIKFGLGYGTQNEIPQSHADFYGSAFSADANASFKFLTLPDSGAMTRTIQKIKVKNPNAWLGARIFFSPGNTPYTPQNFVDYSNNGTSATYANGVLDWEVHNEPNLSSESAGTWIDGIGFGNWLKQVLNLLRAKYPNARFWFPGLSPNDAAPTFIAQALSTGVGSMLYGYCFHNYWQSESGGTWNMTDETGGLSYKKLWRQLPVSEQAKPIWISEFSLNSPSVPQYTKGVQYKKYRTLLSQNGVSVASSFVLYWDGDPNKESWCFSNGGSTGIKEGYLSV